MKKVAYTTVSFLFTFALFYLPLSFSAWSFNPHRWSHLERFIFAICFMIFIGYSLVWPAIKTQLPKPTFKI